MEYHYHKGGIMTKRIKYLSLFLITLFVSSISAAQSWELVGLSGLNLRTVAVHPTDPATLLACDYSRMYRSTNGGADWDTVALLSARCLFFHEQYPDTAFAIFGDGTYSDGIWRSTDGGATFTVLSYLYRASSLAIPFWVPYHMYAGQDSLEGVWRSTDDGQTWDIYNDSLTNRFVKSVHCVKSSESTYVPLAGTAEGIYFCNNQGYWIKSDAPHDLPGVDFDGGREPAQCVYAAIDGGSWSDGVYISDNHGMNWTVSWYWAFMTAVLVNPLNDQVSFAADSGYGVIMTTNGGSSWSEINTNLGDKRVKDLAMSREDTAHLYAATCSGLYRYGESTGKDERNEPTSSCSIAFSVPSIAIAGSSLTIKLALPETYRGKKIDLILFDATGRQLFGNTTVVTGQRMEHTLMLPQQAGIYFITVITERLIKRCKLVVLPR